MGLDADFTIHVHWGENDPITGRGDTHPMKDGWPIQEQRLHVLRLRKNNRIHAWVCKNVDTQAHQCEEVYISVDKLKELEQALRAFATDENALPECPDELRGSFFGPREVSHDEMECAPHYANQIRAMWEYIEKNKTEDMDLYNPSVTGYYWASW